MLLHTIKKGSTLPSLIIEFADNAEMDKKLMDATGFATIENTINRKKITLCKPLEFDDSPCSDCEDCPQKTRIICKFDIRDTQSQGSYNVTFKIKFQNGDILVLPTKEDIILNVI